MNEADNYGRDNARHAFRPAMTLILFILGIIAAIFGYGGLPTGRTPEFIAQCAFFVLLVLFVASCFRDLTTRRSF